MTSTQLSGVSVDDGITAACATNSLTDNDDAGLPFPYLTYK